MKDERCCSKCRALPGACAKKRQCPCHPKHNDYEPDPPRVFIEPGPPPMFSRPLPPLRAPVPRQPERRYPSGPPAGLNPSRKEPQ